MLSRQSRNLSMEASGVCAPSFSRVNGKTWQGHAPKKSSLFTATFYAAMLLVSTT